MTQIKNMIMEISSHISKSKVSPYVSDKKRPPVDLRGLVGT